MANANKKAKPAPWTTTKISATLIDFGKPLLDQLPPAASLELRRAVVELIVMHWNALVTARHWNRPEHLQQMRQTLVHASTGGALDPKALENFKVLSARYELARFACDPRAIGEWDVRDTGPGLWNIRCDGRLPENLRGIMPAGSRQAS